MSVNSGTLRDPWLDNAKFLILVLVVIGHLLDAYTKKSHGVYLVFDAIYLFHMPVIIFLLGRFVRPVRSVQQALVTVEQSLIPYLLFQILFIAAMAAMKNRGFDWETFGYAALIAPQYGLWFLLALGGWRVAVSVLPRHGLVLVASGAAALCVGYFDAFNRDYSAARLVNFFPFYYAGYLYGDVILQRLRQVPLWAGALMLAVAIVCATHLVAPAGGRVLFQAALPYAKAKIDPDFAWAMRGAHLALAALAVAGFLALVPRGRSWMTARGQNTLYIYLFHLLPVRALQILVLPAAFKGVTGYTLLPIAAILAWALSHPAFVRIARPLAEPRLLSRWWQARH